MKLAKEKSGYEEVSCFYEEQPINSLLMDAMNQEEDAEENVPLTGFVSYVKTNPVFWLEDAEIMC